MRTFSLTAVTAAAIATLGITLAAQGHASGKGPHIGAHAKGGGQSANGPSRVKGDPKSGDAATVSEHGSQRGSEKKARSSESKDKSSRSGGRMKSTKKGASATAQSPSEPNAVSTKISKNPDQRARLEAMLPAGMTIEEASAGFRNQGQFIAALNASKNQQIDFLQLKEAMTVDGLSLGRAAKQLRPESSPSSMPTQTGGTSGSGAAQ